MQYRHNGRVQSKITLFSHQDFSDFLFEIRVRETYYLIINLIFNNSTCLYKTVLVFLVVLLSFLEACCLWQKMADKYKY